jgi:hypothetical protein
VNGNEIKARAFVQGGPSCPASVTGLTGTPLPAREPFQIFNFFFHQVVAIRRVQGNLAEKIDLTIHVNRDAPTARGLKVPHPRHWLALGELAGYRNR